MRKNRVPYQDDQPSMTQQHFKTECDVNSIMEKYRKTGSITHLNGRKPIEGDVTQLSDFRTNLQKVSESIELFNSLPAVVRKKMNNDPANLPQYLAENAEEAIKFGLLHPAVEKEPVQAKNDDKTTKNADPALPTGGAQ